MQATMMKTATNTGQWSSIFPSELKTEKQSALFVKKLFAVAVSNITYLRSLFPERAFGDRCIDDLNLKILRDDNNCPGSCSLIKWVKGCFDALEKKYLRMVIIGIYVDENNPETVIESYTFKFSYQGSTGMDIYRNDKKIAASEQTKGLKKATIRLLHTLIVLTQTLHTLPDDVWMTMKLLYYDDVTPADYEPAGFIAATSDDFKFDEEPANITIGEVGTNFHNFKLRVKTSKSQFDLDETHEEEKGAGDVVVTTGLDNDQTMIEANATGDNKVQVKGDGKQSESPTATHSNDQTVGQAGQEEDAIEEEYEVKCVCGCNEDDGLMILCEGCKLWQHGICFALFNSNEAPNKHMCNVCAQTHNCQETATDPTLNGLSELTVQATCLWRRALVACLESKTVIAHTFARRLGVDVTVSHGLINRLSSEGYLQPVNKGKRHGKVVNAKKIREEGIPKYFQVNTPDDQTVKENVEIQKLTEKAETMVITKEGKNQEKRAKASSKTSEKSANHETADVKRGKKRATPKAQGNEHFEICDSQEQAVISKKFKKSISSKPFMV